MGNKHSRKRSNTQSLSSLSTASSFFTNNPFFERQFISFSNFCLYRNEINCIYVWGDNYYDQLGLGDTKNRLIPTLLTLPNNEKISCIAVGYNHTICSTENNLCYSWGQNDLNQLGLGDTNNRSTPTLFSLPNKERISFITCGANHTICLTKNNLYYVWGDNSTGQLGLGDTNNRSVPTLLQLPDNERIIFITCGYFHTICLTENNLCYVWGYNEYGQLGLGDTNNYLTPTLLALPNTEIACFTCGYNYTICLTENNLCYVWGRNQYGQLGLGDTDDRDKPTLLTLPKNESIFFITCGSQHTICLTQNNLCYVWGRNDYGQLGLSDKTTRSSPTLCRLPNNEKISFVTCGEYHTLCLTQNSLHYVWGRNNYGQLGLNSENNYCPPTLLTSEYANLQ